MTSGCDPRVRHPLPEIVEEKALEEFKLLPLDDGKV